MVEVLDETNRFRHGEIVADALGQLLAERETGDRSVTVVLVDDAAMQARNRSDRGVDDTTDVLSYPTAEPDDDRVPVVAHLGDIFVSLDTAERQAAAGGQGPLHEVLVLVAHGLTHLLGHDHPTPVAWRPFRAAERRILELAGLSR